MSSGMETRTNTSVAPPLAASAYAGRRVHLIGVAGSGMRALAQMLLDHGALVSGSDLALDGAMDRLVRGGAKVHVGQQPQNVPAGCDLAVYSAAVHEQNPELIAARQRCREVVKYSQMLGRMMGQRVGIAVSGTHGKSTTTAMVAYVLKAAGADPSFIVGATVEQLGGPSGAGAGRHFVAEACEFDRSFLNLRPHYAAILNIEEDHLDCYQDLSAIVEAFRAFSALVPADGVLVANGESREVAEAARSARCEAQTFGLAEGCTWRGANLAAERGRFRMDVLLGGREHCSIQVPLPGLHNAYNSLAAIALLHHAGLEGPRAAELLATFTGARRRMTLKGRLRGVTVLDDYAHHPTEIQVTLRAIRDYYQPRRVLCVFQPHQHSRTRFLLKDFARCFGSADEIVVPDIYFVRDSQREKDHICAEDLVAQIRLHGGAALYLKTFPEIAAHLRDNLREGDLVVTMGAGNIWEVADETVRWLGGDRQD